jgi:hypothetical protein
MCCSNGRTALDEAIVMGNPDVIAYLRSIGAPLLSTLHA